MLAKIKKWLPLLVIATMLVVFLSTDLKDYLSFESLKSHQSELSSWTQAHFALAILLFVLVYIVAVAVSLPGAVFLTLGGGFLFGPILGSVLVVFSATIGATILFFAVQTSLGSWLEDKASGAVDKMREGFQKNAFSYLLFLRLIPVFPFWVVNIVPALLGVSLTTYVAATFIGIIPGSIVYVLVGHGLSHVFATNDEPNLGIILQPQILYPLIALGLLALAPVIYQKCITRGKNNHASSNH